MLSLYHKKREEAFRRIDSGEMGELKDGLEQGPATERVSYRTPAELPMEAIAKPSQAHVDADHQTLLIPFQGQLVRTE